MPRPFPYQRAAYVLAVGAYFNRKTACDLCKEKESNYDYWLKKKKTDKHLEELFFIEFQKLAQEWVGNATKTLNLGFLKAQEGMDAMNFADISFDNPRSIDAWANAMKSLATVIKTVGELTIGGEVLHEEDIAEDREREMERLRSKEADD